MQIMMRVAVAVSSLAVRTARQMRGGLETERTGGKIRIIIKNFVEKDEFRLFTADRK